MSRGFLVCDSYMSRIIKAIIVNLDVCINISNQLFDFFQTREIRTAKLHGLDPYLYYVKMISHSIHGLTRPLGW